MTFHTGIHMSLKVIHTSIQIDFNHKSESKLIKTINLVFHFRNRLGWTNLNLWSITWNRYLVMHRLSSTLFLCWYCVLTILLKLIQFSITHEIFRNANALCIMNDRNRIAKYPYFNLPPFSSNTAHTITAWNKDICYQILSRIISDQPIGKVEGARTH